MKITSCNLIPKRQNPTPDYYCTWQTQLYATSDGKPEGQRAVIGERALFEEKKPFGWAYFYSEAREDLFLVMDDSWDVPPDNDLSYCASLVLNKEKFPVCAGNASDNAGALKELSGRVKALGWKGLGGWVCAQESPRFKGELSEEEYWIKRLKEAEQAGMSYWKVDWGNRGRNADFRRMLTRLGRKYAPRLVIEHAMTPEVIADADVFRTYDVPAVMSIPMTMEKIAALNSAPRTNPGNMSLLNCEDEVYIAAAGGFSMGVMRHPYAGAFPNGKADMSFPAVHRNLKTKITEVIRAARWHRIAPAFAFPGELKISDKTLTDTWIFEKTDDEIEAWWLEHSAVRDCIDGGVLRKTAPAVIARNIDLPAVTPDENGLLPFTVAARNPNGAVSVATLGRTSGRKYYIPKCDVTLNAGKSLTIGVFGEYRKLIIRTDFQDIAQILIQDIADFKAYDATEFILKNKNEIIIPGEIIAKAGRSAQPPEDTSEPGAVIRLVVKE